jgi:hypothetical protein
VFDFAFAFAVTSFITIVICVVRCVRVKVLCLPFTIVLYEVEANIIAEFEIIYLSVVDKDISMIRTLDESITFVFIVNSDRHPGCNRMGLSAFTMKTKVMDSSSVLIMEMSLSTTLKYIISNSAMMFASTS